MPLRSVNLHLGSLTHSFLFVVLKVSNIISSNDFEVKNVIYINASIGCAKVLYHHDLQDHLWYNIYSLLSDPVYIQDCMLSIAVCNLLKYIYTCRPMYM